MDESLEEFESEAVRALGGGEVAKEAARKAAEDKVVTVILKEVEGEQGSFEGRPNEEEADLEEDVASEVEKVEAEEEEEEVPLEKEIVMPSMFNVRSSSSGLSTVGSMRSERSKKSVRPSVFSFDNAHPAFASAHYLRTKEQDLLLRQSIEGVLNSPPRVRRRPKKKKRRNNLRSMSMNDIDLRARKESEREKRGQMLQELEKDAEDLSEAQESLTPKRGEDGPSTSRSVEDEWQTIQRLESKILRMQSGIDVLKKSEDFKDFWSQVTVPASPEIAPRGGTARSEDLSERTVSFADVSEDEPSTSSSPILRKKIKIPGIMKTAASAEEDVFLSLDDSDTDVEMPSLEDLKGKRQALQRQRPGSAPPARPSPALSADSTLEAKNDEWKPIITRPKPFSFLERDEERSKTKPISTVKMEQDLLIKDIDTAGKKKACKFKAKPIPKSVLEARYQNMIKEQETMRIMKHEAHKKKQENMQNPFAFDLVDKKRQEIKQKKIREAQEAKMKVKPFRANAVPASTYEPRYELLQMEKQRRSGKIEERARKLMAESKMPRRMEIGLEDFSPIPRAKGSKVLKSPKKRPKTASTDVPDYKKLHQEFEERLSQAKAKNLLKRTIVREFSLGGRTKEEAEANQKRVEKRMKSILKDIEGDSNNLKELRWPYMSKRAPIRPTKPNYDKKSTFKVGDTLAARLKAAEVRKAKERGQFDTREEKELRKERKRQEEAKKRKQAWKKLNKMHKAAMAIDYLDDEAPSAGPDAPAASSAPAARAAERDDDADMTPPSVENKSYSKTSSQHVIARHKQVAKRAAEIVEKALLAQGVDAYNFVKEPRM